MRLISKIIGNQEKSVSNSGDSLGSSVTLNGNPLSFNKDTAGLASNTVITLEPIQAGTGDPSPSNVRAISGYDKVDVLINKKNLLDKSSFTANKCVRSDGKVIDESGIYLSNRIYVKPNTNYYITNGIGADSYYTGCTFDSDGNVTGTTVIYGGQTASGKITTSSNACYILLNFRSSYLSSCQFEEGSSGTSYESYNPDLSIAMPGTIYGGTLDVESGELVVDKAALTITSSIVTHNSSTTDSMFSEVAPAGIKTVSSTQVADVMCDKLASDLTSAGRVTHYKNKVNIYVPKSVLSASSWVAYDTWIDANKPLIVYELATPITYHLTPHQVALLQGANVVTTNGTSIQLTYRDGELASQEDLLGLAESVNAMDKGSIRISSESSETYGSILTKLASMIDTKKITHNAKIEVISPDGLTLIYILGLIDSTGALYFYCSTSGTTNLSIDRLAIIPNGVGTKYTQQVTSSGFSSTNHTSTSFSGIVVFRY